MGQPGQISSTKERSDDAAIPTTLSLRWQRAALLGSLWAANEIVLGSFLHNVNFPLTGTLLAAIGVTLLVAGLRLWQDPGIVWRAGLICALLKSLSPSSVILGPMIGIFAEAFLLFLLVTLFRRHTVGCVIGGMAVTMTPMMQKMPGDKGTAGSMMMCPMMQGMIQSKDKQTETTQQSVCPVMGGAINKEYITEYRGKKVYFCCPACINKFKAEPEKYAAKLPQFKE